MKRVRVAVRSRFIDQVSPCLELDSAKNEIIVALERDSKRTNGKSHVIITFHLETRAQVLEEDVGAKMERVTVSKLNLVDLAGSERILKTSSTGEVLKEAKYINKSLSFLEQVVVALGDKRREHVPYRQSKLTHILKDSLGGNCNTLMLACIWPAQCHLEQTLSTLKFAVRMMRVKNKPIVNDTPTADTAILQEYKREIQMLRQELSMQYQIMTTNIPAPVNGFEPYSDQMKQAIRESMKLYVRTGDQKHIRIHSVRHATTMMETLRDMIVSSSSGSITASAKVSNNFRRISHQQSLPEEEEGEEEDGNDD